VAVSKSDLTLEMVQLLLEYAEKCADLENEPHSQVLQVTKDFAVRAIGMVGEGKKNEGKTRRAK
jgi:hypothetical protein